MQISNLARPAGTPAAIVIVLPNRTRTGGLCFRQAQTGQRSSFTSSCSTEEPPRPTAVLNLTKSNACSLHFEKKTLKFSSIHRSDVVLGLLEGALGLLIVGEERLIIFISLLLACSVWVSVCVHAGDVANISLSGNGNEALDKAIRMASRMGIKFTAGNHGVSATERSPARANGRSIYTMCANVETDDLAWFSNSGTPPIDFCAPGVGIKSTYKDGL
jgi:hypothetical protein